MPKPGCWRMECTTEGSRSCNFFESGKWIDGACRDVDEVPSPKPTFVGFLNRVTEALTSFSFEDIGSLASQLEGAAPAAKALAENLILWIQDPFQAKTIKAEKEAKALQANNEALQLDNEDLRERLAAAEASLELATSSFAAKATKFVKNLFFKESPMAKDAAPEPEDKDPRAQNKDLRAENEDLRERLAAAEASLELATSAESPAKAFVKTLRFKEPSNASEVEALREQLAAAESRAATAASRAAEELAAAESRAAAAEASLVSTKESAASAESRAAAAEAGLAASTTQVKESALENQDLRERNAALEEAVVALHASSFQDSTTKGAAQHRRLQSVDTLLWVCDGYCSSRGHVPLFGESYDPETTTQLRVPPAPPTPGARRATAPRRRRVFYEEEKITGTIPTTIGLLTALQYLRVLPASPDARRAARPPLGVAGTSRAT